MTFLPDTPITITFAVALLLASLLSLTGGWRAVPGVAIMCLTWLAARAITAFALDVWWAVWADMLAALAFLAVWSLRAGNMAVLPLAAVSSLMVIADLASVYGLIGRETMWAFGDVGGYLQLVILAGLSYGGGHLVRLAGVARGGRRDANMARAVAHRVPAERHR